MKNPLSKLEIDQIIDHIRSHNIEVLIGLRMVQLKQLQEATTDDFVLNIINKLIVVEDEKDSSFHWEIWSNPETSNVEPVKVYEYTLQSFEEGLPVPRPGMDSAKRPDANSYLIHRFNYSEYEEVKKAQKVQYHQKVLNETEVFKESFEIRYDSSGAKELLLKSEIDNFEKLLFKEKLEVHDKVSYVAIEDIILPSNLGIMPVFPVSIEEKEVPPKWIRYWDSGITNTKVLRYRNIFNRIIINGQRDYSVVNNNGSDIDFVRVEAIWNYLHWLRELKEANPIESSEVMDKAGGAGVMHLKAKHYVLAYMLDLLLNDKQLPHGRQKYLENEIGKKFNQTGFNGYTFQREFRDSQNKYDIKSSYQIENYFDTNWREKVKEVFNRESTNENSPLLSNWPEIDNYLKSNDL